MGETITYVSALTVKPSSVNYQLREVGSGTIYIRSAHGRSVEGAGNTVDVGSNAVDDVEQRVVHTRHHVGNHYIGIACGSPQCVYTIWVSAPATLLSHVLVLILRAPDRVQ